MGRTLRPAGCVFARPVRRHSRASPVTKENTRGHQPCAHTTHPECSLPTRQGRVLAVTAVCIAPGTSLPLCLPGGRCNCGRVPLPPPSARLSFLSDDVRLIPAFSLPHLSLILADCVLEVCLPGHTASLVCACRESHVVTSLSIPMIKTTIIKSHQ